MSTEYLSPGIGPLKGHNTYLLMADSLDRSGGIGFRCVADAEDTEEGGKV